MKSVETCDERVQGVAVFGIIIQGTIIIQVGRAGRLEANRNEMSEVR